MTFEPVLLPLRLILMTLNCLKMDWTNSEGLFQTDTMRKQILLLWLLTDVIQESRTESTESIS